MAGSSDSPLTVVDSPVGARTMPAMRCHGPDDSGPRAQFMVLPKVSSRPLMAARVIELPSGAVPGTMASRQVATSRGGVTFIDGMVTPPVH